MRKQAVFKGNMFHDTLCLPVEVLWLVVIMIAFI